MLVLRVEDAALVVAAVEVVVSRWSPLLNELKGSFASTVGVETAVSGHGCEIL
jgi:hypothetical protein